MLYYLVLVWNPQDPDRALAGKKMQQRFLAESPRWTVALSASGMAAFYYLSEGPTIDRAYALAGNRGVIFGRLFEKRAGTSDPAPEASFDMDATEALVRSDTRALIESYWGRYVAFIHDTEKARSWVLRDPTGAVPCLQTSLDGVSIYFVRLEDRERCGVFHGTINDDFLLGFLGGSAGLAPETGLREVNNVLPGQCITHVGMQLRSDFIWNPFSIALSDGVNDFDEATRLVSETVRMCVSSWGSCFSDILIRLSGGLDSSIVLSCLANMSRRPRIVAQNEFAPGTRGDERRYARLTAQRVGCELLEVDGSTQLSIANLARAPRAVSPHVRLFDRPAAEALAEEMRQLRIKTIFEGHGGDEVFYKGNFVPTAVDYVREKGLSLDLLSYALDDAQRNKLSLWNVLGQALKYGVLRAAWPRVLNKNSHALIPPELLARARGVLAYSHPLFANPIDLPPGKHWHVRSVARHATAFWAPDRLDTLPTSISPLLSQPLIELCLRIPTYILCAGPYDRSVARAAFDSDLPPQVSARSSKGSPEQAAWAMIFSNIETVKALLLNGYLVERGILDRVRLERLLKIQKPDTSTGYAGDYLTYLNIESWANNWRSKGAFKSHPDYTKHTEARPAHLGDVGTLTRAAETGAVDGALPTSSNPDTGELRRLLD